MAKAVSRLVDELGRRSKPDTVWTSRVTGCTEEQAEEVGLELASQSATVLELCGNIRKTGRSYYAQFPSPIDLYSLVRLVRPGVLVESGVASGVSSAFMLMGIEANSRGALHSIDLPAKRTGRPGDESWAVPAGMTSGWAVPTPLQSRWDLRKGRSEELLVPLLEEVGTVDLFCHDSPVDLEHFRFEMEAVGRHLGPGSLVVADNTYRKAFDEAARRVGAEAVYRKQSSLGAFRVPPLGP